MKHEPKKCAIEGCKNKATSWINQKFVCVRHFYQLQLKNGKAPRKLPQWMLNTDKHLINYKKPFLAPFPPKFEGEDYATS
jgi:hypothetical protein